MKISILGSLTIVAAAAFMVTVLGGCAKSFWNKAELVNTQTIPLDQIDDISINYVSESVTFYKSDSNELILKEYMNKNDPSLFADINKSGSKLTIKHGTRPLMTWLNSHVEVYLPQSYQGSLDVGTVSGKISSDVAYQLKDFEANSTSGSIKFSDIGASDTLTAETTSGSIRFDHAAGDMDISSTSGSIKVFDGKGSGSFDTTSGSINLEFAQLDYNLEATSTSGSVNVQVPKDLAFDFHADSVSGGIHTPFDESLSGSKKNKSGTVGSNAKLSIRLSTTSGGIEIKY